MSKSTMPIEIEEQIKAIAEAAMPFYVNSKMKHVYAGTVTDIDWHYELRWKLPSGRVLRVEYVDHTLWAPYRPQTTSISTYKPWGPFRLDTDPISFSAELEEWLSNRLRQIHATWKAEKKESTLTNTLNKLQ